MASSRWAEAGDCLIVLADPYSFATGALLERLGELRPGMPVLGGLASASAVGSASLFRDGEVLSGGAVGCSVSGASILPCVSQGAAPVGPEMTITAAAGNVIEELASRPALERLREALGGLEPSERELAASGLMLGIVIDENKPEYRRGDFLVRPIIGADAQAGTIALGERVRVGQTVRMQIRDAASADEDLRAALRGQLAGAGPSSPRRRPALHLQRSGLPHVRGSRSRRGRGRGRPGRPGGWLLLRRGDRPGRRSKLPPRLHRDDGRLRRRLMDDSAARPGRPGAGGGPRCRGHHLACDGSRGCPSRGDDRAEAGGRRVRPGCGAGGLLPGRSRRSSRSSSLRGGGATRCRRRSRRSEARRAGCSPPSVRRSTSSATCPVSPR